MCGVGDIEPNRDGGRVEQSTADDCHRVRRPTNCTFIRRTLAEDPSVRALGYELDCQNHKLLCAPPEVRELPTQVNSGRLSRCTLRPNSPTNPDAIGASLGKE